MKTKMLITVLLVVIVLVACSPAATPIAIVLPTPPPTPLSAPGSANAQGYQLMEIQDAQGRVKLKNLGDDLYRFYAYEDGYDVDVGNGLLLLKAGYSYTFEWYGNREQVEVRLISNDQLVGYWLQIMTYDRTTGSFTGIEKPIAIVDSNGDGLMSLQELDTALAGLREEVKGIAESQPSFATKFEADIASANAAINSGAIADAYRKIKQLQLELAYVEQAVNAAQAANDQAAKDLKAAVYLNIAMVAVILFLVAFWLVRRRRSKILTQQVNTTPGVPDEVVKRPKLVESQAGEPEPTGKSCPKCGYSPRSNDLYCRKCGEKLR